MNTKLDLNDSGANLVYVRRIATDSLPAQMQEQVRDAGALYAVHGEDGERLAIVAGRKLAFALARQHEFTPVSVH